MNPFTCTGTVVPQMFGRQAPFNKICDMLNKDVPEHISIIGPKRYGKTVLLHQLFSHLRKQDDILGTIFIDLRRSTPQTDDEFLKILSDHLCKCFKTIKPEYSSILEDSNTDTRFESIYDILQDIADNDQRLVIILDSFDFLPIGISISPNLLDQLRTLVTDISALALVVGSRQRLRELCKSEASRGSNFWQIFAEPIIQIGALEGGDFDPYWTPFESRSITVEKGAKSEFITKTGGVPLIVSGLLKSLYDGFKDGSKISQVDVATYADRYQAEHIDALSDIWEDCDQDLLNLLVNAATGNAMSDAYPATIIEQATQRGFAVKDGGKIKITCRIIANYAKSQATLVQDMNRLFAKREDFEINIKRLLELRLGQMNQDAPQLLETVKITIKNMDVGPTMVINNARMIRDDAIKVICNREGLTPGGDLPVKWHDKLVEQAEHKDKDRIDKVFPTTDGGPQIRVLSWLSGCDRKYATKLTAVTSRRTFYLLRTINEFGNFMNHGEGEEPSNGTGALLCMTAIELIDSLSNDLITH